MVPNGYRFGDGARHRFRSANNPLLCDDAWKI
jgi:hypothetical protein